MSCLRLHSRCGEPTAPRKYLVVTMLAALTDQKSGNSTPCCSKLIEPSRQFVMTTSRRSQVTWSWGCTPAVVWMRCILSRARPAWVAFPLRVLAPLTVSVIACPPSGICPDPRQALHGRLTTPVPLLLVLLIPPLGRRSRGGGAVAVALAQGADLILEVGERLESSVDRGEPEVGHLVQIPERAQDG